MALNLVQHRVDRSVWDQLQREPDTERWVASALAGVLLIAGIRRRSAAGLFFTLAAGSLGWWAATTVDKRTALRGQVRAAMPTPRRTPDPVREASEESFPASDAPAWTPTTGNTATTVCGN